MRRLAEKKPPTKKATPRKKTTGRAPLPLWRRRSTKWVAFAAVALGIGAGSYWVWAQGYVTQAIEQVKWRAIALSSQTGLVVDDVFVTGRERTDRDALLNALKLERGTPILAFEPQEAKGRIESLPWVADVVIERRLPDRIFLRLEEKQPLAIWQNDGKMVLIDLSGEEIKGASVAGHEHLPLVVGQDAPAHTMKLLALLSKTPDLKKRVKAAVRVGNRRWNLVMDTGVDIRLPEGQAAEAWLRLAQYQKSHDLLARDLTTIDLRLPDRLIVRRKGHPDRKIPVKDLRGA